MKILVTGGLGFIGNRAAHYFKDKGYNVHIVDNTEDKTLVDKALKDKFEVFWMDISSPNVNYYLDNHYDVIIHCAAQTAVTHSLADPIKDMHDNIVGTLNMCELARICDAHLIYTSTNKVYGTNPNNMIGASGYKGDPKRYYGRATHEDVSIDHTGHTPYGVSKLAADLYVQDYRRVFKIPTTVFRMSCIYGETQRGTEDQGWVYHITKQMVENKPVKIFGDGRQVRDILHVDDLVRLMEKVIDKNITGVYNVGGGINNSVSVLELMSMVKRNYGKVTFHDWRPLDQLYYVSDIHRITGVADWRPRITIEEGLARLIKKLSNL